MKKVLLFLLPWALLLFTAEILLSAGDNLPKDFGVYIKTDKGFKRLTPNMVLEEGGIYFIEPLNPPRFLLREVEYFVVSGTYNIQFLTINPMVPWQKSFIGRERFMFGKELPLEIRKAGEKTYVVKQKGLIARGYYAIWIEETAWDFILE